MYTLRNPNTGKSITVTNKIAKEVFSLTEKHTSLLFFPTSKPIIMNKKSLVTIIHNRKDLIKMSGICVIRMGGLGDLVILSSTLKKLKLKYPNDALILATRPEFVKLMENLNYVDLCISVEDLNYYSFDRVIDLRYAVEPANIGPGKLMWRDYVSNDRSDNFDKLCKVNSSKKYFQVTINSKSAEKIARLLRGYDSKPIIGLNPTCTSMYRCIPPDYVSPLIHKLKDFNVVLFGVTEGWNKYLRRISRFNMINLLDKLTLYEMIALCAYVNYVITPDTSITHIAGALNQNCLTLFGNIDPMTRIKYYNNAKFIYPKNELACIPCWDVPNSCHIKKPGSDCMRLLTPDRISKEVKDFYVFN